jgi:hypothetical protein
VPIDTLTVTLTSKRTLTAEDNVTGFATPLRIQLQPSKAVSYSSAVANNAAGGADLCAEFIVSVAGGGTATIDLQSVTDLLQTAAQSFARIKSIRFHLLSSTLDAGDDATNGTACSSVTIGDAATNANAMFLGAQDQTVTLPNGADIEYRDPGATGITVDGTHSDILITNNDGSVTAKVKVTITGGTD